MNRRFALPGSAFGRAGRPVAGERLPERIAVVHAPGDVHHVEIFLRPLLDGLYPRQAGTWRCASYDEPVEALAAEELVILCRPRFPAAPEVVAARKASGRPTIVMIDDNWIAAGREYARYSALFLPGRPDYESFLACVRDADATVVFNAVLAEDLRPLSRSVEVLPIPFDMGRFGGDPSRAPELGLSVGYAGSPRFEPSAFAAMARLAAGWPELQVLVMGHEVPGELASLPPGRVRFEPFRASMADYAARLAALRPTVLVAPLDATRFSASKCPLKFLDATAAGVPGVYSAVPPYSGLVRHGADGLLADNSVEAWQAEIGRLLVDSDLRERIVRSARRVVEERFSVAGAIPAFARMLSRTTAAVSARG